MLSKEFELTDTGSNGSKDIPGKTFGIVSRNIVFPFGIFEIANKRRPVFFSKKVVH